MVFREKPISVDVISASVLALICWSVLLTPIFSIDRYNALRDTGRLSTAFLCFLFSKEVSLKSETRTIYAWLCVLVCTAALTAVLEALGVFHWISMPGARPGGTLGNRNVLGRLLCLAIPIYWRQLILSRFRSHIWLCFLGTTLIALTIVLSRSRGVWLVTSLLLAMCPAMSILCCPDLRKNLYSRTCVWAGAFLVGGTAALFLPNHLSWTFPEFVSSGRRIIDFETGTGRGRALQAQTTLRMIAEFPVRGVGPANWSILYPAYAQPGDPSYSTSAILPAPEVPRGDGLYFMAELGVIGFGLGVVGLVALLKCVSSLCVVRNATAQATATMLAGGTAAVVLLGLFDPVLKTLPLLAFVACVGGIAVGDEVRFTCGHRRTTGRYSAPVFFACAALCFNLSVSSARDLTAFRILTSAHNLEDIMRAVSIAPQNVPARASLAYVLVAANRCDLAEPHIQKAARLQPYSGFISGLRKRCESGIVKKK